MGRKRKPRSLAIFCRRCGREDVFYDYMEASKSGWDTGQELNSEDAQDDEWACPECIEDMRRNHETNEK